MKSLKRFPNYDFLWLHIWPFAAKSGQTFGWKMKKIHSKFRKCPAQAKIFENDTIQKLFDKLFLCCINTIWTDLKLMEGSLRKNYFNHLEVICPPISCEIYSPLQKPFLENLICPPPLPSIWGGGGATNYACQQHLISFADSKTFLSSSFLLSSDR